jgi:hypothetical protein
MAAMPLLPKAYIQVGLAVAGHREGQPYLRAYPAVHGIAPVGVLTGGVRLMPDVAVELEASLERSIATPLQYKYQYLTTFTGELRDSLLDLNLRWNPGRKYHLEMVVGGGLALSRYAQRSQLETDLIFGGPSRTPPDAEVTYRQATLGGGLSVPIRIGATAAIVPSVSYHWIRRPGYSDAAILGASRHVYRVELAVRRHARSDATSR